MSATEVLDDIYHIQLEYGRVFVLDDVPEGGTTLVDTGFDRTADELVAILCEEFGGVENLYLTHDGGDHYGGVDAVVEAFDPTVYAASDETDLLDAIDHEPDEYFEDGDVLPGNVEVIQIPGHSPCPSGLLLRDRGAFISGDILDGADRRGLPEGYLLPPPETFNWDHQRAEKGLEELLAYDFDTVLVFHGSHVLEDAWTKLDRYVNFKDHYRQSLLEE